MHPLCRIVGEIKLNNATATKRLFNEILRLSPDWSGYISRSEKTLLKVELKLSEKTDRLAEGLLRRLRALEPHILDCELSILEEEEKFQVKLEPEGISLVWA